MSQMNQRAIRIETSEREQMVKLAHDILYREADLKAKKERLRVWIKEHGGRLETEEAIFYFQAATKWGATPQGIKNLSNMLKELGLKPFNYLTIGNKQVSELLAATGWEKSYLKNVEGIKATTSNVFKNKKNNVATLATKEAPEL